MPALAVEYTVNPGDLEFVLEWLARMKEAVASDEPGCQLYEVWQSETDSNSLLLIEVYESEEALARHRETPHFKALLESQVFPRLVDRKRRPHRRVIS